MRADRFHSPTPEHRIRQVPVAAPSADPQARFQLLVLPHLDRLLAFAARQLDNLADAEDAVQDCCARAWVAFKDLRDETALRPWLFRILRSSISDLRSRSGRRERLAPLVEFDRMGDGEPPSEEPGPFEQLVASLSRERVATLLRAIPEEFAVALQLHDIEGFRYREIADITSVPTGTVMSRIYRGRKLLGALIMTHAAEWDRTPSPVAEDASMENRQA